MLVTMVGKKPSLLRRPYHSTVYQIFLTDWNIENSITWFKILSRTWRDRVCQLPFIQIRFQTLRYQYEMVSQKAQYQTDGQTYFDNRHQVSMESQVHLSRAMNISFPLRFGEKKKRGWGRLTGQLSSPWPSLCNAVNQYFPSSENLSDTMSSVHSDISHHDLHNHNAISYHHTRM